MIQRERELYLGVAGWLAGFLKGIHPRAKVTAHDTHSINLSAFLHDNDLHDRFEDCDSHEIQVDVTGIVRGRTWIKLAFVECKIGFITLRDVGQLLGYSLVAKPEWSYLVSPKGMSARLQSLLVSFGRQDILSYSPEKHIRIAAWNSARSEIELGSLIPRGSHE